MIDTIKPTDKLYITHYGNPIDYNEEKINALKVGISEKYNVPLKNIKYEYNPIGVGNNKSVSSTVNMIENLQDPSFFLLLSEDYLAAKKINDVNFEDIKVIDSEVNQYIDYSAYTKRRTYKVEYMKWSNFLSFGPDNYFDFTNLHGLVLLNSAPGNQGGKTTFALNLLRFGLFGKSPKSPNLNDVFNRYLPETTTVMVEVGLEIEGEHYVIRRTITRPALKKRTDKSKPKQSLEYFKRNGDGSLDVIENCEGESTQQTNNIIKETIGNPDDFDLVVAADKKTLDSLFDKGKTEQGRLFSRWLGLTTIEEKEAVAKDIWKKKISPNLSSNLYNRATLELEIRDLNNCNEDNQNEIAKTENRKTELNGEIKKRTDKMFAILKNKKAIKEELQGVKIESINNSINDKNRALATAKGILKGFENRLFEIKDIVFDEEKYNGLLAEKKDLEKDKLYLSNCNGEIVGKGGGLRAQVAKVKELIEAGVCPHCSQKIDTQMQDGILEDLNNEINTLLQEHANNLRKIKKYEADIQKKEQEIAQMEQWRKDVNEKIQLNFKISAQQSQIQLIEKDIEDLLNRKRDIETNKENLEYNEKIDNDIKLLETEIAEYERLRNECIAEIAKYNNNITHNNKDITKRQEIIGKLLEEEKITRNWAVYQELVGKNGVIKIVLKRALPLLNSEIARILSGICDFGVELDIDDKNEVSINMVKDGVSGPIEIVGSGFEKTFAALAVRNALAGISAITRPNFLCLDECTSTINSENYDNLKELYKRILSNYQFILDICHNTELDSIHNMEVTIVKENNISKIV